MAWYNAGVWTGLPIQDGATLLCQILYAINERQAAQTASVTVWDAPVSTSYPAAANCAMNFSQAYNLLGDAQTAIGNLCTAVNPGNIHFVKPDYTTAYTLSSLLTAGSYGGEWIALDRADNVNVWLQIQEALGKLIYLSCGIQSITVTATGRGNTGKASAQEAWTAVLALTPVPLLGTFPLVKRYGDTGFGARADSYGLITFVPYVTLGTFVAGVGNLVLNELASTGGSGASIDAFTCTDSDGDTWVCNSAIGHSSNITKTKTMPPSGQISFTIPEPPTVPFDPGTISVQRQLSYVSTTISTGVKQLIVGTDLTYG